MGIQNKILGGQREGNIPLESRKCRLYGLFILKWHVKKYDVMCCNALK
jgi:hypothetical protein